MKVKNHKTITRLAIELCKDRLSQEILENKEYIIQGAWDEDTTQLISRALNWHFYRANTSPIPKKIRNLFNPTSENIFQRRVNEFYNFKKDTQRFNSLGRIVHHIQDMCTPSHVIPIYHGPELPVKFSKQVIDDYLEDFMEIHDKDINLIDLQIPEIDNSDNLYSIYHNTAEKTLNSILKIHLPVSQRPYSHFWKHYTEEEFSKFSGFGVFGENHELFNNYSEREEQELLKIQKLITKHAIISTAKILLFVSKYNNNL